MKLRSSARWLLLGLASILIVNLVGCGIPEPTATPAPLPLPAPDPLESAGDELYSIYRKGLITRHITINGRLLQTTALTNVGSETYDGRASVRLILSDGSTITFPVENARYSEEYIPGGFPNSQSYLWIPVVAPIKNPGLSNDGYYFVSGGGDNPGYYGGMAIATFSLEAIHGVSPYSLDYARRMVRFFLASEMWPGNGYIIRQARFFNSGENRNSEPIIRGASAEELLGIMLGLMFYLEAEDTVGDPGHPTCLEARALRDRILGRVPLFPDVCVFGYPANPKNYEHPFMVSAGNSSYDVSHFSFPLYASRGEILDFDEDGCGPKNDFFSLLTGTAGRSASFVEVFGDVPFDSYLMYLISMILILESDIPDTNKQEYAEIFMDDFIKAANTGGPDVDNLQGNAFWSVMALLVNKYLNPARDPLLESQKLRDIWDDEWPTWLRVKEAHGVISNPRSGSAEDSDSSTLWQHNLPLMDVSAGRAGWKDHHPSRRIGKWFVWKDPYPYYWAGGEWHWLREFPGTYEYGNSPWAGLGGSWDVATYKGQAGKKYTAAGYVDHELVVRGHDDNQVEGAGLGLLFPRMLLTHIDPERFPPPQLPDREEFYDVLPWGGIEPNSPQFLYHTHRYYSKDNTIGIGTFEIEGDQDQALRIVTLGDDMNPSNNFVVAYATDEERLKLIPGFVSDGHSYGGGEAIPAGVYVSETNSDTRGRFDKMEIARTKDDQGNEYIVVAERAEDADIGLDLCRDHWLRLSLWRIDGYAEGHAGRLTRLDKWVAESRDCDAVEELDLTIVNQKYAAVIFRGHHEKNRLAIFELDFSAPKIRLLCNEIVSEELYDHSIGITTAYEDILVYVAQYSTGWRLASESWTGSARQFHSVTSIRADEKLLDMTAVKRLDYSQPDYIGGYYVVAVTKEGRHLRIYSWEVTPDGMLTLRGQIDTVDGEDYLVGREADWERASISSLYWKNRPGFVIVGKGVAREVRDVDGDWQQSAKGLKVLYGYIMDDGHPTIESSNVTGSGDPSAMRMLDVSGGIAYDSGLGVVTAHKTKDDYLMLVYWHCRDDFERYRWRQ